MTTFGSEESSDAKIMPRTWLSRAKPSIMPINNVVRNNERFNTHKDDWKDIRVRSAMERPVLRSLRGGVSPTPSQRQIDLKIGSARSQRSSTRHTNKNMNSRMDKESVFERLSNDQTSWVQKKEFLREMPSIKTLKEELEVQEHCTFRPQLNLNSLLINQ